MPRNFVRCKTSTLRNFTVDKMYEVSNSAILPGLLLILADDDGYAYWEHCVHFEEVINESAEPVFDTVGMLRQS